MGLRAALGQFSVLIVTSSGWFVFHTYPPFGFTRFDPAKTNFALWSLVQAEFTPLQAEFSSAIISRGKMISCYIAPSRQQNRSGLRVAVVLALFVAINIISHQAVFAQFAGAYAWGDQPSADSYTPSTTYSFSSASDSTNSEATITRSSVGVYNVSFAGLENVGVNGGHVQVSGYNSDSSYCGVGSWSSSSTSVYCFDTAGVAVDAFFTVAFLKPEADTPGIAYAWVNDISSDSSTASTTYSYNPGGNDVAVTRAGVGNYTVLFEGYDPNGLIGGHVQVSSYGGTSSTCTVRSWGAESVNVLCFDPVGAPVDAAYTVLYTKPEVGTESLAYAWANNASADTYTPSALYSYNPTSAAISISRSAVGTYNVSFDEFAGVGFNGGNVLVTAYGGGAQRCKVSSWGSSNANILCLDTAGSAVDANYTVMFWKPESSETTGTAIEDEIADLDDPSTLINFPNPFSGTTTITYSLETSATVELTVHDITGRVVNKLVDRIQSAGDQSVVFDASGLSAGLYFYHLKTSDRVQVGKMTVGW